MQKESINTLPNYSMLLAAQQQLCDYRIGLHLGGSFSLNPQIFYGLHQRFNSRFCPEPKPSYSYIGLIAMAILNSPERKLVLSDIYQWILDNYPYFRTRGPGWRNSIRHNLSLNDCFIKAGRSANGKGHYWSIHPANLADFVSGDFRRRRAQRRVRKSMGLSVPDDEDDEDDDPILLPSIHGTEQPIKYTLSQYTTKDFQRNLNDTNVVSSVNSTIISPKVLKNDIDDVRQSAISNFQQNSSSYSQSINLNQTSMKTNEKKRCFDVDSLLASEKPNLMKRKKSNLNIDQHIYSPDSKSDGSNETDRTG